MQRVRQLYLAATGMNRGKTTTSLGLLAALLGRGLRTGFIKPVGQRYAIVDGVPADEDAILMRSVFGLPDPLSAMSPVHIPRGFTKAYISGEVVDDLAGRIREACALVTSGRDVVLIEGTGHAGVGGVVGLSNAEVARMLRAPAVIVSEGGVGRPIDEIVLNQALFERHGVPVVGAIINKVAIDAQPGLPTILEKGLARRGIPLLGVLPYRPLLSNPTLSMLVEQLDGELLHPGPDMDRAIEQVAVGAMQAGHMLERLGPGSLLIVPGDRDDLIQATVTASLVGPPSGGAGTLRATPTSAGERPHPVLAGIVLTDGYRPSPRALEAIRHAELFAFAVEKETYETASAVHDLLVKTHPDDTEKIDLIRELIAEHLDVDRLLGVFSEPLPAAD